MGNNIQKDSLHALKPNGATGSDRVTLQVGEGRFHTLRDTLVGESTYFAARLSGRWNDADKDGSYFVDADPDRFKHILNYLRTGNFPLFFDTATRTFDNAKYFALLGEAQYFGIQKLEEWIRKKEYLAAVKFERSTTLIHDVENEGVSALTGTTDSSTQVDFSTAWSTKQVYICPRGIFVHNGDQSKCGQACERARTRLDCGVTYEEKPILSVSITTTKMSFNLDTCMGDKQDTNVV
ncbi:BTB/POZ protein [Whalleya microplaca]|nr:BTB/POZ protein [Whalleya microplaca]